MATLRVGRCYRNITRAFTRKSKVTAKGYIKAVPTNKITRFDMGDSKGKFNTRVDFVSKQDIQLRHNSVESARMIVNRHLTEYLGTVKDYYFKIRVHPHHVLRENKMLTGAGADRMSTGMSHGYGRPMGLAAQVPRGNVVFSVFIDAKNVDKTVKALNFAKARIPGQYGIAVNKL
jgi:large subunit ribosomal protein L10e